MMATSPPRPSTLLKAALFLAVIFAALWLGSWIRDALDMAIMPEKDGIMFRTLLVIVLVYVLILATPFLPGAEIGLVLLTAFGAPIAPIVYLATIISLTISYTIGRTVPPEVTARALERVGLHRAAAFLREIRSRPREERLEVLLASVQAPWARKGTRLRYLVLALLLNMPGNVVLGGGGGLCMVAGLSRVFHPGLFLLTVMVAVAPVPLFVVLAAQ
ncbi:MAG: hypothetical protein AAGH73_07860 [Pseudomonadota bacterium]